MLVAVVAATLCSAAAAGAAPRISFHAPGEADPGSRINAKGRVSGLDGRATVQAQLRRNGRWRMIGAVNVGNGRFRLSLPLPRRGAAVTLRGAIVRAGRRLAVSAPDRVRLARRQPAQAPPPASTASTTPPPAPAPAPPAPAPPPAPPVEPPLEPLDSVYWGGYIDPEDPSQPAPINAAVDRFSAAVKKVPSLLESFSAFATCDSGGVNCNFIPFPAAQLEAIRSRGAVPFFTWASEATSGERHQPNFQLADIIAGTYDPYITSWASAARAWGHPFFLRFNWEMNGNWYPWSVGTVPVNGEAPEPKEEGQIANGNSPAEYALAWQHVHDIFTATGATNATWVWCPYIDPNNGKNFADLEGLYPGDEYVDWTCLDGYNYGSHRPAGWKTFAELFGPQYAEIANGFAATKPMVIAEVASTEAGGSKAAWISEMFATLPTAFPAVRGLMWFDYFYDGNDWWLRSSITAQEAFAAGVADPRYPTNVFGALSTSPIPPP